eukprot:2702576-Rhodomonas_salina.1
MIQPLQPENLRHSNFNDLHTSQLKCQEAESNHDNQENIIDHENQDIRSNHEIQDLSVYHENQENCINHYIEGTDYLIEIQCLVVPQHPSDDHRRVKLVPNVIAHLDLDASSKCKVLVFLQRLWDCKCLSAFPCSGLSSAVVAHLVQQSGQVEKVSLSFDLPVLPSCTAPWESSTPPPPTTSGPSPPSLPNRHLLTVLLSAIAPHT